MIQKYFNLIKSLLKKHIILDKKWGIVSGCLFLGLLLFWKMLPKSFSTFHENIAFALIIDCFLCLTLFIRIQISEIYQKLYLVLLLIISPAMAFIETEKVVGNNIRSMTLLMAGLNYVLYLMVFLVLYAVTNRIRIAIGTGMTIFTLYALGNSFIVEFRGNGIRTADIFAVKTAMNVSGGYELIFTYHRAYIILLAFAVILFALHCDYRQRQLKKRAVTVVGTLCCLLVLQQLFWNKEFMQENNVNPFKWELLESARKHGALLEFAAGVPSLKAEKPDNYSLKLAGDLERNGVDLASESLNINTGLNGEKPDIIVIMNESFSDLRSVGEFVTDQDYLGGFRTLQDDRISGQTSVPVYGGLTANTEFEFMTGFSTAFFPSGIMPYQNYIKKNTPNICKQLKSEGYHSIFMHPMNSSGWNRRSVYQTFGFDEAYYIDDWKNLEYIRGAISDRGNYKDVIARYEEAKEENDRVFLFNVTMQNHGGYSDPSYESTVHITNLTGDYPQTEQYLSLIRESDTAFQELVTYFANRKNPVVICMFGDHQPSVETEFYDEIQENSKDSEFEKQVKKYQTPYILYSNYQMEKKVLNNISTNYLQLLLMEAAEIPLNDYQKYLSALYNKYPVVNVNGVMDKEGNWYGWEEAQNFQEIKDYSIVQYSELFDRKNK